MKLIEDDEFIRDSKIPMTKKNVRLMIFAKSNIDKNSVVYDIGAGTGAVSIDSARLSKFVYAIEKNPTGIELIRRNAEKFNINNLQIINDVAPHGIENLPPADFIFIGGTGGNFLSIVDKSIEHLKSEGTIIITAITLQTITRAMDYFSKLKNFSYDAIQLQINKIDRIKDFDMLKAENPIFIFSSRR